MHGSLSRFQSGTPSYAASEQGEHQHAARSAEEARERAERERAIGGCTVANLERPRAETADRIAERQTHVRADAVRELLRQRAERLQSAIEGARSCLSAFEAEQAAVLAKLR